LAHYPVRLQTPPPPPTTPPFCGKESVHVALLSYGQISFCISLSLQEAFLEDNAVSKVAAAAAAALVIWVTAIGTSLGRCER